MEQGKSTNFRGDNLAYEHLKTCNLCGSDQLQHIDLNINLCKCNSCGYIFDNPRPSFEDIQEYYSRQEKYDMWLENISARENLWKRRLKIVNLWKKDGSLLDIGTGIGQFIDVARDDFREVKGTEISSSAIRIAKEKYDLDIIGGAIEQIELEQKFDNITLFHVLEHVENPKLVIDKCWNLLNNEGRLIIAVPNDIDSLKARLKEYSRKKGFGGYRSSGTMGLPEIVLDGSVDEIHLSHFTTGVLEKFLENENFKVICLGLDPYFIDTGFRRIVKESYYLFNLGIWRIFHRNYYDTILIVAEKKAKN